MNVAGHLCGDRCQQLLDGDFAFISVLQSLGIRRIQINATVANAVIIDELKFPSYRESESICSYKRCYVKYHVIWSNDLHYPTAFSCRKSRLNNLHLYIHTFTHSYMQIYILILYIYYINAYIPIHKQQYIYYTMWRVFHLSSITLLSAMRRPNPLCAGVPRDGVHPAVQR